ESKEKAWNVQTIELSAADRHPEIELLGTVESPYTSELRATVNADVTRVDVSEGQYVAQGQILLTLDDRETKLALLQREADVIDLQSQVESEINRHKQDLKSLENEKTLIDLAERAVARESKLKQSNVSSEVKMDQSRQSLQQQQLSLNARELNIRNHQSRLAQLRAKLKRAEAQLSLAQLDQDRTLVRAPFSGRITAVTSSPGERARIGDVLISMYDEAHVEVRGQIPNRWITTIQNASQRNLQLSALALGYGGQINLVLDRLSGKANAGSGGIDGLFRESKNPLSAHTLQMASAPQMPLLVGQILTLKLQLPAERNVFAMPVSSIYGNNRVYRVKDSRLEAVRIDHVGTQIVSGKQLILVKSAALQDGDRVITTQLPNAINGLKVTTAPNTVAQELIGQPAQLSHTAPDVSSTENRAE
ncbi:MAG: HlyD family efflux transporter periplasmic adaptor subunit, partial [Pseudomonadales bacterium]|nr:HlyD family efflux transporter periplasmic adaptor subunit [Pseudomonadales bacterium]